MAMLSSKIELVQFHRLCAGMAGDLAVMMAGGRLEAVERERAELLVLGRGWQRQRRRVPGYKQTRHISKHIPRGVPLARSQSTRGAYQGRQSPRSGCWQSTTTGSDSSLVHLQPSRSKQPSW
jgi:hypothetical protein